MFDLKLCFCVLCGLPASGKSTFVKNISSKFDDIKSFISPSDNLPRLKVLGIQFDDLLPFREVKLKTDKNVEVKPWKSSRQEVLMLLEDLVKALIACVGGTFHINHSNNVSADLQQRFSQSLESLVSSWSPNTREVLIIIDDNMHLRSMRYDYYKVARAYGASFCQIYMEISPETALIRNRSRKGFEKVSDEVITKMTATFETPDGSKHSWEKMSLTISSESVINYNEVTSLVRMAFMTPVQPVLKKDEDKSASSRNQCVKSVVHQADLILRKCVSSWLAQCRKNQGTVDLEQCVKCGYSVKENILKRLRQGECDTSPYDISDQSQYPESSFHKFIEELFLSEIIRANTLI